MKLEGKTAIVTAASTGIGRAIAKELASRGTRVGLVGRNKEGLTHTADLIRQSGGEALIFIADLLDQQAINRLASDVERMLGSIDIVVNVAGVWHDANTAFYGPNLADTPAEQIIEVLDVGIKAPMLLTRLFLPGMIQKKSGKIINISGTFASGGAGWLHYFVSKKAIEQFTIGLGDELREHQIQVNCICPSDVATDALKRFFPDDAQMALDPAEVAKLATVLLTEEVSDHITGQIITIKQKHTPVESH